MVDPFKMFPEPRAVSLRRICLAQAAVCVSALASTAVLLSRLVPMVMRALS